MTIPADILDAAISAYQRGDPTDLACAGRCSPSALKAHMKARDLPRRPKGHRGQMNPDRDAAMRQMHDDGYNYSQIGRVFGITKTGALLAVRRARR